MKIKDIYNKKYEIPVYSGTLAITSVLKILSLNKKDKVLIASSVCYSILEAILMADLTPVIAVPKNGVTLTEQELKEILDKEKISVFIAVHQYGYEQPIIKKRGLTIIEDISQSWNLSSKNKVGSKSDYIITSLGKTKPLSNGIGGLILTNKDILKYFDYKKRECRNSNIALLEYYYDNKINDKKLIKRANKRVKKQRKNALLLDEIFNNNQNIIKEELDYLPSYHRYVINIKSNLEDITNLLDKYKIPYQKEYKIKLSKINYVKENKIKVINSENESNLILIKVDKKIKKLKKMKGCL